MQRTRGSVHAGFFGPALAVLGAIALAAIREGRGFGFYLRDPTAIAALHPMAGVVSQLGALLWCAAAVACFLTAAVLKRRDPAAGIRFQLAAGLLTTVLLLDDLFQGHEYLVPRMLPVGEHTVEALYALAVPLLVIAFRRAILEQEAVLIGLALLFLASSLVIDLTGLTGNGVGLAEDGLKFLGITAWSAFFLRMAAHQLSAAGRVPVAD